MAASPNVLLVLADDMGVDASPCHNEGSDLARMPVLTALCDSGLVFDAAYTAPVCSPTRAAIMTGRHGFRTGVSGVVSQQNDASLSPDEVTLFDRLNEASNYTSAVIGKWHLSANRRDLDHPAKLGVDYFYGPFSGGVKDYSNWVAVEQGQRISVNEYATTAISDKAIDWIDAQSSPWFLWLAYNAPHTPFHKPPNDLHGFDALSGSAKDIRQNPSPYYFAALEALDTELGRVLGSLSRDERDEIYVIFMGDNGSPGQLSGKRGSKSKAKGSLYDGGTRVPLVVTGPDVPKGRVDSLVNSTDLFATILALVGVQADASDSIDFSDTIINGAPTQRTHAYSEISSTNAQGEAVNGWAIRDDRYKLINYDGRSPELYDMQSDPSEARNLLTKGDQNAQNIADKLAAARPH